MWAANRTRTAEENAQRGFERYGAAFAAVDVDDYVRKTHAFVAHPPAGAQTLTRTNGDTLIYDPAANVFAVVTKAGAPRTMFKPDDGAAYWAMQKTSQSRRTASTRDRAASADS
jgi:pyocin large subunit-like protein